MKFSFVSILACTCILLCFSAFAEETRAINLFKEVRCLVCQGQTIHESNACLLYTSPSPRDVEESRMPSSA